MRACAPSNPSLKLTHPLARCRLPSSGHADRLAGATDARKNANGRPTRTLPRSLFIVPLIASVRLPFCLPVSVRVFLSRCRSAGSWLRVCGCCVCGCCVCVCVCARRSLCLSPHESPLTHHTSRCIHSPHPLSLPLPTPHPPPHSEQKRRQYEHHTLLAHWTPQAWRHTWLP